MKKALKILIPLVIIGAVVYQYWGPINISVTSFSNRVISQITLLSTPCSKPIPYKIGTFDPQFGISQKYFLSALADAEAIWEKPYGKNLFAYSPTDSDSHVLKINLIYDYRQQATSKLANLGITVSDDRASYDMLKAKFTALKVQYATQKKSYDVQFADFNQRQQAYNAEVQSWNAKGGAPQQEYDKLQIEKSALDAQSLQLQTLQTKINGMVDEINALVVALNRLVSTLNLSVDKYNTVNTSRGESFEEGVYSSDGLTRQIDIYEFSSRAKLVRVLAHELGHALGLEHVDDSKAIMYKLNQGNNETLTKTDLAALKAKCQIK